MTQKNRAERGRDRSEVKSLCCKAPVIYTLDKNDAYGTCSACGNAQNSHLLTTKP